MVVSTNANLLAAVLSVYMSMVLLFVKGLTSVLIFAPGFWNLLSSETLICLSLYKR